jgi:ribonuclease E
MSKIMLINVLQPEECRIAILENGVLEELYVERTSHESYVGNIYKGRIVNIEPSIQAAFVDFGVGRNGFLHVSDVEPAYYRHLEGRRGESGRDRGRGSRDRGRGERDRELHRAYGDIEFEEERLPGHGEAEFEPLEVRAEEEPEPQSRSRPWGSWEEEAAGESVETEEDITVAEFAPSGLSGPASEEAESSEPTRGTRERVAGWRRPTVEEALAGIAPEEGTVIALPPEVAESALTPTEIDPPAEETPETEPATETRKRGTRQRKEAKEKQEKKGARSSRAARAEKAEKPARGEKQAKETEEEKPKRSSTTRKRKSKVAEGTEDPAPEAEGEETETPKPRLMDSAERRTDEEEGNTENGSPEPTPDDEDLFFFPRPQPRPPVQEDTSPVEPEVEEEAAGAIEEAEAPAVEEAREFGPRDRERERGRERGGRRRRGRSLEEELEEDLRAAEVGRPGEIRSDEMAEARMPVQEEEIAWEEDEAAVLEPDEEFVPSGGGPRGRDDGGRDRGKGGRRRPRGRGRNESGGGGGGFGRGNGGRPKPLIQDIFKRGQEVIVQVIKEGLGSKGPTLSTYISIAGRYLVLMPGLNRVGVSRKIQDEEQRRKLRTLFTELNPPKGLGFIIRTACEDKNKKELQRDLAYLSRLWQVVVRRIRRQKSPCEIYQESDRITRTLRDTFSGDIDTIIVDEPNAFEHAREFLEYVMPRYADRIQLFAGNEPLFHKYGIEDEIDRIQQRKVPLPNGGSVVIEQTEALVAIDVNSGNFRASDNNAEETAYQINLQAAREIARQLRLRDLGGVIVNDFIDMREEKHRKGVEKALRDAVKRDRARTKVLRMSAFGIIEMTRQRVRPSLKRSAYTECIHCKGTGHVKTAESMSIEVMRLLQLAAHRDYIRRVDVRVTEAVANCLHNRKRKEINGLEETGRMVVNVTGVLTAPLETLEFFCYDNNNNEVRLFPIEERRRR